MTSLIRRVYKMIAEDAELGAQIDAALKAQHEWPRDMAGVFWRLDCAAEAGELKGLDPTARVRLQSVVAAIWHPFERGAREPNELDPHYHGALYTQALVAWLCAWRSGMATDGLVAVVQRCGRNLVEWKRTTKMHKDSCTGRVRERLHTEYLQLSHEPIWGVLWGHGWGSREPRCADPTCRGSGRSMSDTSAVGCRDGGSLVVA